ncbi:hypothetical protein ACET3Z_018263 [Daucus carota]
MNEDMDDAGTNFGDNLDELFHRTVGNMQNLEDKKSDGPSVHAEKLYRRFEEDETSKDLISEDILHGYGLGNQVTGVNWCREDVPVRKVRIPPREPAS